MRGEALPLPLHEQPEPRSRSWERRLSATSFGLLVERLTPPPTPPPTPPHNRAVCYDDGVPPTDRKEAQ